MLNIDPFTKEMKDKLESIKKEVYKLIYEYKEQQDQRILFDRWYEFKMAEPSKSIVVIWTFFKININSFKSTLHLQQG